MTELADSTDSGEELDPATKRKGRHLLVGSIGLHYACYQLARRDWNVVPTSRNARGVDILAYSQDATRKLTIQVKSLTRRNPVPLGADPENWMAEFYVAVVGCSDVNGPVCYVMTAQEVRDGVHTGERNGKKSYWLQPKQYSPHREAWDKIGGGGGAAGGRRRSK